MKKPLFICVIALSLQSCSENYSNGERIGFVTKFSQAGLIWKSWEGELNLTQTGMNTSSLFPFSIDNDNPLVPEKIAVIDSAANQGWKIKVVYRQTRGKNWFGNRGASSYFIKDVIVLDRTPMSFMGKSEPTTTGKVIDTIYVVIDRSK